jgi:CRISPR-associated protein Csx10
MNALPFEIRLVQPVLASQPQSKEANSNISYPYIPGSMLRGALATCYANGITVDLSSDLLFMDLFFNAKVRYLNAYPINPDGHVRMLPRPISWFARKTDVHHSEAVIFDFAINKPDIDEVLKPPEGAFFWRGQDTIKLVTPEIDTVVHNASTDRNRKKEGSSQVFRYDSLSAGQTFGAVIISQDRNLLVKLKDLLLAHDLYLGGSTTGGYGRVQIGQPMYIDDAWQEDRHFHVDPNGDLVYLTCLSDVIYRAPNGEMDFNLETLTGEKPVKIFHRTRLVGGFNRKWGLPLMQDWAIEAGSVFAFPSSCRKLLETCIVSGIGERLVEGYGRIALDLHREPELQRSGVIRQKMAQQPRPDVLSETSNNYAQAIANRKLERSLNQLLTQRINDLAGSKTAFKNLPKPAQLSRARLAARKAWQSGNLTPIKQHFSSLSDLTMRSWKNATLRNESLVDWIKQRASNPSAELLPVEETVFAGVEAQLTPKLRARTVARLIEGVLKLAVTYAKQEGGDHE